MHPSRDELAQRAELILQIRAAKDACLLYRPNPIQKQFHESKARYRILRGVNRGGKTMAAAWDIVAAARRIHPTRSTTVQGKYIVCCPYRDQITDPWGLKLLKNSELMNTTEPLPLIPEWEIERLYYTQGAGRPTIHEIALKNGNAILFYATKSNDAWLKMESKGMVLGIALDEAVGDEAFLTAAVTRLLDACSHPKVIADCGGGWLSWSGTQTNDNPALDGLIDKITGYPEKYSDYKVFTLTAQDNKAVAAGEREKLKLLMEDDDYAIRMEGSDSAGSQMRVYPQWDDKRHFITDPTRTYVPSDTANIWVGYDPGVNFTGIVFGGIEKDAPRTVRIFKVLQLQRSTIENDVIEMRRVLRGRFLEGFIYDQAARKIEKTTGESVANRLGKVMQSKGYEIPIKRGMGMGRSRYADSVPVMRHYLDPKPNDKTAEPLLTVNGDPDSGGALLRAQILRVHLTERAARIKEDDVSAGFDHTSDACRYLLTARPYYTERGPNPYLWQPGEDPDNEYRHERAELVLSEDAMRLQLQFQAGARMAKRRLGKLRNRARL